MLDLNRAQFEELMKRVETAVNSKYPEIYFDQSELLQSAVLENVLTATYVPEEEDGDDVIPSLKFLKGIAKNLIGRKSTGIFENKKFSKENRTDNRSAEDFNFQGEKSEHDSKYFQNCSYEFLQENAGWEPSTDSYEQILLNNEITIDEQQREAFRSNPMFNAILLAAIDHVNRGGSFKSFSEVMGYTSPQVLKTFIKKQVKLSQENNYLDLGVNIFASKQVMAGTKQGSARRTELRNEKKADKSVSLQMSLF